MSEPKRSATILRTEIGDDPTPQQVEEMEARKRAIRAEWQTCPPDGRRDRRGPDVTRVTSQPRKA